MLEPGAWIYRHTPKPLDEHWLTLWCWWERKVIRPLEPVRNFFGRERFLDFDIDLHYDQDPRVPCDVCGKKVWDEDDPDGGEHYDYTYPDGVRIAYTRCADHPLMQGEYI